jgi:hypothetical protein
LFKFNNRVVRSKVAVSKNPFREWEKLRQNSDYRSTDTQITSFVRQQLSQSDYLLTSNRVNPGPFRNLRASVADNTPEVAHVTGSEDLWGWQSWTGKFNQEKQSPDIAENLIDEDQEYEIPGVSYQPQNNVGGASV